MEGTSIIVGSHYITIPHLCVPVQPLPPHPVPSPKTLFPWHNPTPRFLTLLTCSTVDSCVSRRTNTSISIDAINTLSSIQTWVGVAFVNICGIERTLLFNMVHRHRCAAVWALRDVCDTCLHLPKCLLSSVNMEEIPTQKNLGKINIKFKPFPAPETAINLVCLLQFTWWSNFLGLVSLVLTKV